MVETVWSPVSCDRADRVGYYLWSKPAGFGLVFQITNNGRPPPDDMGGHYKLDKLLALKGL